MSPNTFQMRRQVGPAALHALRCPLSMGCVWECRGGGVAVRGDGRERREPDSRSSSRNREQLRLCRPVGQQLCSLGGVRQPASAVALVRVGGVVQSWWIDLGVGEHSGLFAPEKFHRSPA